jgi:hypothetical protein
MVTWKKNIFQEEKFYILPIIQPILLFPGVFPLSVLWWLMNNPLPNTSPLQVTSSVIPEHIWSFNYHFLCQLAKYTEILNECEGRYDPWNVSDF